MLDKVFFVWIRTGSYPPDSNGYEKLYSNFLACLNNLLFVPLKASHFENNNFVFSQIKYSENRYLKQKLVCNLHITF